MPDPFILTLDEVSASDLPLVGGKGANLGELRRAGFLVPPGFCLTTAAFRRFLKISGAAETLYADLDSLSPDDLDGARQVGATIRAQLEEAPMPDEVERSLLAAWQQAGSEHAYAVRSSATAEDLPTASFAGQQETYLNVRGPDDLVLRARQCWASLFTDRAILYRARNGFDHRAVGLAVVVQRMVEPEVSGILFTADPVSGQRTVLSIDASFGLGEAIVQGLVTPDLYRVHKGTGEILTRQVAEKQLVIRADGAHGVRREALPEGVRSAPALDDDQIHELAELGVRVESHYGAPQDLEWAYEHGRLYLLQARPITSLFPLPAPPPEDESLHVYVSLGHAQVMTDPMPPMSRSIWRLVLPFGRPPTDEAYNPYICSAAGRLYIDPSPMIRRGPPRRLLPNGLRFADPLMARAVQQVAEREAFRRGPHASPRSFARYLLPFLLGGLRHLFRGQPHHAARELTEHTDAYVDHLRAELQPAHAGAPRLRTARAQVVRIFTEAALNIPPYLLAGVIARLLVVRLTQGRADPADIEALLRGLEGNVTTEMDLAVGDLADIARRHPALAEAVQRAAPGTPLAALAEVEGGQDFLEAFERFLTRYGMRAPSEIDISRPRYRDAPGLLLQVIAGSLARPESGAHRAHHQRLVAEGQAAVRRLQERARHGILGPLRARLVGRMAQVARSLMAIREHPKFLLIQSLDEVRRVILETGARLAATSQIEAAEEIWYLEIHEAIEALERPAGDWKNVIAERRATERRFHEVIPPRVITSEGEIVTVQYDTAGLPDGALAGNPVSAGMVEGVARVITNPEQEALLPGEILVAPFTDPGWTPLFLNAAGLVMEVGGLMTHGSVVAREYGIPAVVGIIEATRTIRSGQRLRVDGDRGYVLVLDDEGEAET